MSNDNRKDIELSIIPKDDVAELTTESPATERELDDDELAAVAAGYQVAGQPPPSTNPDPGHFSPM